MAVDRQGMGFVVIRICLGVVFIGQSLTKIRWLLDSGILKTQLDAWLQQAAPGSIAHLYVQRIGLPGASILARLVPLGEFVCGLALLLGFWTPFFAAVAFFMVLNYHIASGALFEWSFLTNRMGLPMLGSTLGLALGGLRLPWSVRS
jgi:uncharacterized membrane protein YphA (DoxX/SURF4 family)